MELRDVGFAAEHVERPAYHTHEKRNGAFVDFQSAFKGYAQVAYDKDGDNGKCHRFKFFGKGYLSSKDSPFSLKGKELGCCFQRGGANSAAVWSG